MPHVLPFRAHRLALRRGGTTPSAGSGETVRDMIQCPVLLTGAEEAVETACSGRFVPRGAP